MIYVLKMSSKFPLFADILGILVMMSHHLSAGSLFPLVNLSHSSLVTVMVVSVIHVHLILMFTS